MLHRRRFRTLLLIAFLAVSLISLSVSGIVSLQLHRQAVDELSAAVMQQSLGRVVDRLRERVDIATDHQTLYKRLCPDNKLSASEFPELFHQLWTTFEPHSELSYLGVGIARTGEYAMLYRLPDGTSRVRTYIHNPESGDEILDYRPTASGLQLVGRMPWKNSGDPLNSYVLRERPFFQQAEAAGTSVWTDSYQFWNGVDPASVSGVTYATPVYDSSGKLSLVWDIDLELNSLSRLLESIRQEIASGLLIAEHRRDGTWKLLATPTTFAGGPTSEQQLQAAGKEFIEQLTGTSQRERSEIPAVSELTVDGKVYRIASSALRGNNRPDWVVAALWSAEAGAYTHAVSQRWLVIWLVIVSSLAVLVAYQFSRYVAFPLQILEQESRWLARGERTRMPLVGGPEEIRRLGETLNQFAIEIQQRQRDIEAVHAALRVSHERLQVHISDTPVGMLEVDPDGNIVTWNRAAEQIFGWSAAEALGQRYDIIVPDDIKLNIQEVIAVVLQQQGGFRNENQNVTKDGRRIDCEWYNTPLIGEDGYAFGIACLVLDVTERNRTQAALVELNEQLDLRVKERTAELQQALQDLESFSYSVAHDLRAPLRSIAGFSQALAEDCVAQLNEDGNDYLQRILAATQRMADLLDALLRLTRVVRQEPNMTSVNLSGLVEQALHQLQQLEPDHVVTWRIQPDVHVRGDRPLLRILIENLCDNAWKYSRGVPAPEITFFAEEREDGRWFALQDNGVGFDAEFAHKATEPFQRLHRMEDFEGHGIGLATASRIARKHGGEVRLAPAPAGGAICWFRLQSRSSQTAGLNESPRSK